MRMLGTVVGGLLAVVGIGVLFVVVEASWGTVFALAAVAFAAILMPLVITLVPLREAEAWAPSAGAREWGRALVVTAGLIVVLFAATARVTVSDALDQLPGRHPRLGPVARVAARVGRVLGPRR